MYEKKHEKMLKMP